MKADQDVLIEYLLRTVRVVVWSTFLVVAALALSLMLPGAVPNAEVLAILLGVAFVTGLAAALLPWNRLLRERRGLTLFYVWTTSYIVIISAGVSVSGGGLSPVILLYALTIVFAAIALPIRVQIALFAVTILSYLWAISLAGWHNTTISRTFVQLCALALVAFLAGFLSRELARQMQAHASARAESERRNQLLAIVARAGRSVSSLDTEQVLEAVVSGALRLGFEGGNLAVYDDAEERYRVAYAMGLPDEYVNVSHPASAGLPGLVRERGGTVVLADYAAHPAAVPVLSKEGFHVAMGTPVWVQGSLEAALIVATRERRPVTEEDVEAFELLAALAGRALENARRFEDEHRTVRRLAELDGLKSDFLSNVSHELRTPLTAIEGMGQTLELQWDALDDPTRRELLGRLNANAGALHQIITTLLDFSRVEAGRLEARVETVELRPFLDGVLDRLDSLTETHWVTIEVGHGMAVRADPVLLERVMENLLSNAVKHTPEGTAVEVSAAMMDGAVELSVTDEGPGIPESELRYIGDRFFRGGDPNTRRTRGTGLGLALIREILKLHGSRLEIFSEVGQGSRFSFRLPLAQASPTVEAEELAPS